MRGRSFGKQPDKHGIYEHGCYPHVVDWERVKQLSDQDVWNIYGIPVAETCMVPTNKYYVLIEHRFNKYPPVVKMDDEAVYRHDGVWYLIRYRGK